MFLKQSIRSFGATAVLLTAAQAAPLGTAITYQGQLKQSGVPYGGTADLVFTLYLAASGGPAVAGPVTLSNVSVVNGLFTVQVDFGAAFDANARWMEIQVSTPSGSASYATLSPRQAVTPTPYAAFAAAPWVTSGGGDISYSGGNVGIGTAAAASKVDIASTGDGAELLRLSTDRPWVFRQVGSSALASLELLSTIGLKQFRITAAGGTNVATFDANDASPKVGVARTTPTFTLDVRATAGIRLGLDGNGGGSLVMINNANDNRIYLEAYNSTSNGSAAEVLLTGYGGLNTPQLTLKADTTSISGKVNVVTATSSYGLEHTDGTRRMSTFVSTAGGWLGTISNDPLKFFVANGPAAMTINTNGTVDIGGHDPFSALTVVSALGRGATVQSTAAGGVGLTVIGGPGGVGINCAGSFSATGTKTFRIDHPLDPENKYLVHYCSEGPEPLDVYSGMVSTDAKGEAWVDLPAYFEALNKDFRYTLTVVEDTDSPDFVQVKVSREVSNNRFKIRTSAGNVKVSWEVKGVRNDPWIRANGTPVEVVKAQADRGKYQHPELYSQAKEKGQFYSPGPVNHGGR